MVIKHHNSIIANQNVGIDVLKIDSYSMRSLVIIGYLEKVAKPVI